VQRAVMQP